MSKVSSLAEKTLADKRPLFRRQLLALRKIILSSAATIEALGGVKETTKWAQLSYLPKKSRVGTTIRIDQHDDEHIAMYVHCQTTLIQTYKTLFPELTYAGNRGVLFAVKKTLPRGEIAICVEAALTYHLRKKQAAG